MICPDCNGTGTLTAPGYTASMWDDGGWWYDEFYCHLNRIDGEPERSMRDEPFAGPTNFTYHDDLTGDCYRCSGTGEIGEEE